MPLTPYVAMTRCVAGNGRCGRPLDVTPLRPVDRECAATVAAEAAFWTTKRRVVHQTWAPLNSLLPTHSLRYTGS